MQDIDETLRRTVRAVHSYQVPERLIGIAATSLTRIPAQARQPLELDALNDALLDIADQHGGPHESCLTCHAISNGLAVALGVVRAEVDLAFERKIA